MRPSLTFRATQARAFPALLPLADERRGHLLERRLCALRERRQRLSPLAQRRADGQELAELDVLITHADAIVEHGLCRPERIEGARTRIDGVAWRDAREQRPLALTPASRLEDLLAAMECRLKRLEAALA
jgi:hypothetical protein